MNIIFFLSYRCPKIGTYPSLSMPPIYHTYSEKELTDKSKVSIEDGIQEMAVIYQHRGRQELYTIQQSLYRNASYLYRLLHYILSLFEESFNPNRYEEDYGRISDSIYTLSDSQCFNESDREVLISDISHIGQSIEKFRSILFNIYNFETATACHNLRNYFSMKPPNESQKMSEYITENHSSGRISLFETLTQNPIAYQHLLLTSSIEIEEVYPNNTSNKHICIHFRENDIDIEHHFTLNATNIGMLYYTLLSAVLHDAIPEYTKPDDINKKHLAFNGLCSIIVIELLLIHWEKLSRSLKFFYNSGFGRNVFSQLIYNLGTELSGGNPLSDTNPVGQKLFEMHVELMNIIEMAESQIKEYRRIFTNYIDYIQTKKHGYSNILHKYYKLGF